MSFTFTNSDLLRPLIGHKEVEGLFSTASDITSILAFEIVLAKSQEKHGQMPKGTAKRIAEAAEKFDMNLEQLAIGIARDGLVVPTLIALLKKAASPKDAEFVHKDATSQDVIDSSLMMRANMAMDFVHRDLVEISGVLENFQKKFGNRPFMAHTRMQQALPTTVSRRLEGWQNNLDSAGLGVSELYFPLQLSGPIGAKSHDAVKKTMAKELQLKDLPVSWQNDRWPILAIGNACAGVTGALGKIGADIALMAQNEFGEIKLSGGGTSSAMPHKQNPVKAEVMVSLARFNASLLSALHNAAVHEQERSGAAWTLEWLVLPQMICATAGSARLARELLESVESIGA
jgi:3-carboxy-cis,cis-muconate cycloisomerase